MNVSEQPVYYKEAFLQGGGEMGNCIRTYNWAANVLGEPSAWPQSLRSTVSLLLHSRFPMFLFWGPQLICFYNDAYRTSLDAAKHPAMLGMPAKDAWREAWHTIQPLIDGVIQNREATWSENQMVPVYRNGKTEDTYWTFSYSPVIDENGDVAGVLSTGMETTASVHNKQQLEHDNGQLQNAVQSGRDATKKSRQSEDNLLRVIRQAPVAIAIFRGENYTVEIANDRALQLWGKQSGDVINKPILEAMPELQTQGIKERLDSVYKTRVPFSASELPLQIQYNGKLETRYINFVFEALFDSEKKVNGIIAIGTDVTLQVENRKRLQESEGRLEQILNQLPIPVTVLRGEDFIIESFNESMLQVWRKTKEEVNGISILELFPELHNQPFPAQLREVMHTGITITNRESPVLIVEADGSERHLYVDYYYQPLPGENGKPAAILATVVDVTDKVESRRLIEESEMELQAINEELAATNEELSSINEELNQSQDELLFTNNELIESRSQLEFALSAAELGTWDYNPATNLFFGNSRLKEWFGLPPEEEIDLTKATDVIDAADRGRIIAAISEALRFASGGKYDVEYTISNPKTNSLRFVRAKGKAAFDDSNQPVRLSGTLQDITEEKLARQQLADTNQRLQLALDAGKLGSYDLDLLTGNMNCTPQCKANFGLPADAVFNFEDLMEAILPEYRDYVEEQIQAAVNTRNSYQAEYQATWPNGSVHWISASGKIIYNNEGNAVGVTGITLDITERKLDDLRKNDFIGMVSHELKTPLTSLSAFQQILNTKLKDSGDAFASNLLDKANVQVKKMSNLINGFLNVSRFESGKITITKQDFYLNELVSEMVNESKMIVSSHLFRIEKNEEVLINADRDKIGSVISNLLSNAVKYSPQGKTVTISCRVIGDMAQVSVADQGIGIQPKDQERLFDRYYRVESNTTQHISGFGIGLYLSAEIVRRQEGTIWVRSESGVGSTFYFTLPLPQTD